MIVPFDRGLIGIDMGSYSIKIVKLRGRSGNYILEAAVHVRLGMDCEGEEVPGGIIREAVRSNGVRGRGIATAVGASHLTTKQMSLPAMPKRDLKEAVRWEMKRDSNADPKDMVIDYSITGETSQEGAKTLSILAFGAQKGYVEELIKILSAVPIDVMVVDAAPMSLLAAFCINNKVENGVNYALIDVGASNTTLVIVKDGVLRFVRNIPLGGMDMTDAIAERKSLSRTEAEEEKMRHGLSRDTNISGPLLEIMDRLSTEISRSFDYYQAQFKKESIGKGFLSGGSSKLKGVEDYLSNALNFPCFVDDPLRGVKIPMGFDIDSIRAYLPTFSVALGLASRRA